MQIAGTSLEPLKVWKPGHSRRDLLEFAASCGATMARLGSGGLVGYLGARPARILEIYERENCPFSRKVREALSILDLDAVVHPCPVGGSRFRAAVEAKVGHFEIPVLVDPNAKAVMTSSDAIVRHLFDSYGNGKIPLTLRSSRLANVTSRAASSLRAQHGDSAVRTTEPENLLELYSYEASPYCRLVREVLSEFEIPYVVRNVARGSPRRATFVAKSGRMQVPYLVDPLEELALFESKDIIAYLRKTYLPGASA